mmetsp:Transcript_60994/g.161613  ORF Transcript_60994/g.161613 Transcript_60994/m.161613 type:complete len:168 (-) Transcript_60994:459-962(-)
MNSYRARLGSRSPHSSLASTRLCVARHTHHMQRARAACRTKRQRLARSKHRSSERASYPRTHRRIIISRSQAGGRSARALCANGTAGLPAPAARTSSRWRGHKRLSDFFCCSRRFSAALFSTGFCRFSTGSPSVVAGSVVAEASTGLLLLLDALPACTCDIICAFLK